MKFYHVTFATLLGVSACGVTPKQAGDGTKAACTIVEAVTDSALVDSICATAPELASLAAFVASVRADAGSDAGARMAAPCKVIPQTTTCATNAETAAAIRALKAKR